MIALGSKVKDRITGVEGIVVGRTEWLNGCVRIIIQPQELKDGRPVDPCTIDEPDLIVLEGPPAAGQPVEDKHGPRPDAIRR